MRRRVVDVGSRTCAWRCRRRRAAPGDRCGADAACEFLARAPIKSAALLWFGERRVTNTHVTNTSVHAADERRVECSLAHEQSGVGGGAVLELFEGEASRESGNATWESFMHGVEIDICCMQQRGTGEPPKCLENVQAYKPRRSGCAQRPTSERPMRGRPSISRLTWRRTDPRSGGAAPTWPLQRRLQRQPMRPPRT